MDLTMSMFSTQADYWKARADLAEATVRETASALGCKPDNEVMLVAAQDAVRWRWARANVIILDDFSYYIDNEVEQFVDAQIAAASAVGAV